MIYYLIHNAEFIIHKQFPVLVKTVNMNRELKLHYGLFCSFQAVVASFDSNDTGAAHFHYAVGFHQLNESVDLGSFTGQLTDKSCGGIVNDL